MTRQRNAKSSRQRNRAILNERKRRIRDRLFNRAGPERGQSMIAAAEIRHELTDRVPGRFAGGIGAMNLLARIWGYSIRGSFSYFSWGKMSVWGLLTGAYDSGKRVADWQGSRPEMELRKPKAPSRGVVQTWVTRYGA
jgi:hypothetical protein